MDRVILRALQTNLGFRTFFNELGRVIQHKKLRQAHWGKHALDVGGLSFLVAQAKELPWEDCKRIGLSGNFHDYGKQNPEVKPYFAEDKGRLTDEERRLAEKHDRLGMDLCREMLTGVVDEATINVILQGQPDHHKRYDEYGDRISLPGRIINVVDSFHAATHPRHYKSETNQKMVKTVSEVSRELMAMAGKVYDPLIVHLFLTQVLKPEDYQEEGEEEAESPSQIFSVQ